MDKKVKNLLVLWVMMIFITLSISCSEKQKEKIYKPKISTNYQKRIWKNEWSRFDQIVQTCRKIIREDPFLQKRTHFWERYGIEPAVGYTAWLFQESRLNGEAIGDNGRAHGYGQIHPPALREINAIRTSRGDDALSHKELVGRSKENLHFFLQTLHDYVELCEKRYGKRPSLDAKLNAWNRGGKNGARHETKYSGQIKFTILQYYKMKESERKRAQGKRASAKR